MTRQPPGNAPEEPGIAANVEPGNAVDTRPPGAPKLAHATLHHRKPSFQKKFLYAKEADIEGVKVTDVKKSTPLYKENSLDMLIKVNSSFSSLSSLENFLRLYKLRYNRMNMEEQSQLRSQIKVIQRRVRNKEQREVLNQAHDSVSIHGNYSSLEDFQKSSANSRVLSLAMNNVVIIVAQILHEACEESTSNQATTNQHKEYDWKDEQIKRIELIVRVHGPACLPMDLYTTLSQANPLLFCQKTSTTSNTPPHVPDPPVAEPVHKERKPGIRRELRHPWKHHQCIGYLTGRMINFLTSPDADNFAFTLPSAEKLRYMSPDERAEYIRHHLIELDKSQDVSTNISIETYERTARVSSTHTKSPLFFTTVENSRASRLRQETDARFDKSHSGIMKNKFENWSTDADDGNSESSWGDISDSGWLTTQSDDWSPSKKPGKHVIFDPMAKGVSEYDDARSDIATYSGSESGWGSMANPKSISSNSPSKISRDHTHGFIPDFLGEDVHLKIKEPPIRRMLGAWGSSADEYGDDVRTRVRAHTLPSYNQGYGGEAEGLSIVGNNGNTSLPVVNCNPQETPSDYLRRIEEKFKCAIAAARVKSGAFVPFPTAGKREEELNRVARCHLYGPLDPPLSGYHCDEKNGSFASQRVFPAQSCWDIKFNHFLKEALKKDYGQDITIEPYSSDFTDKEDVNRGSTLSHWFANLGETDVTSLDGKNDIAPPEEPSFSRPQPIKRDNVISEDLLAVIDELELDGILGSPLSETTPGDLAEKQI